MIRSPVRQACCTIETVVPGTSCCSAVRTAVRTYGQKYTRYGDTYKISPGDDNVPSPEKSLPCEWKPKNGETNKNPGREMPPEMMKLSLPGDPLVSRGPSKPSPGEHLPTPPARRVVGNWRPFSPGALRAAVRSGRDAVARPRGVRWRSKEPVPHGAY